jgi:hypothetical protein
VLALLAALAINVVILLVLIVEVKIKIHINFIKLIKKKFLLFFSRIIRGKQYLWEMKKNKKFS